MFCLTSGAGGGTFSPFLLLSVTRYICDTPKGSLDERIILKVSSVSAREATAEDV